MTPRTYARFSSAAASLKATQEVQNIPLDYLTPRQRTVRRKEVHDMLTKWKLKVGFEFHAQIKSKYKMFSTTLCPESSETLPNTHVNYGDLGIPGMLPVLNEDCLDRSIMCALALGGRIPPFIKFDRKHYTYGDLPQGYQITQHYNPIMIDGRLFYYNHVDMESHVLIKRVQMEQDHAKIVVNDKGRHMIDYNNAGRPLLEIITEDQFINPEDCRLVTEEMQEMLATLGVSDARLEKNQFRVDLYVQVFDSTSLLQTPRVEIANINTAENVEKAVEFEYRRLVHLLESGSNAEEEIRRYMPDTGRTKLLRANPEKVDFRFFQDPDLPRINITNDRISAAHKKLREVPFDFKRRFCNTFGMDVADVKMMFQCPWSLELFSRIVWTLQVDPNVAFNWIYKTIQDQVLASNQDFREVLLNRFGPKKLLDLLTLIKDQEISTDNGKVICQAIVDGDDQLPSEIAAERGFTGEVAVDVLLRESVKIVLTENPDIVGQVAVSKKASPIMALVNKVQEHVGYKADPVVIRSLIEEAIDAQKAKDASKE